MQQGQNIAIQFLWRFYLNCLIVLHYASNTLLERKSSALRVFTVFASTVCHVKLSLQHGWNLFLKVYLHNSLQWLNVKHMSESLVNFFFNIYNMCTCNHSCCSVLFEALLVEIKPSSLFEYDIGTPICGQFLTFFPTFTRQDRGHHYTARQTEWSRSDSFVILAAEGHCLVGCLYTRFSSLHRATLELFHSDHWVLGHIA